MSLSSVGVADGRPTLRDDALLAVDRAGCITYADSGAHRLYQASSTHALVGAAVADVLGARWLGGATGDAMTVLVNQGSWSSATQHRTSAGLQRVEVRAHAWIDAAGELGGMVLRVRRSGMSDERDDRAPAGGIDRAVDSIADTAGHYLRDLHAIVARLLTVDTVDEVGAIVTSGAVAALDAYGGHFSVNSVPGRARFACAVGYPSDVVRAWGDLDLSIDTPIRRALVDNASTFVRSRADRDDRFPALEHVDLATSAICAVPVQLGGVPFGCLGLSFPSERLFLGDDREFLDAVAHAAALAIDRVLARSADVPALAPSTGQQAELAWADPDTSVLSHVRHVVAALLVGAPPTAVEDAMLCASELVTNALLHARPPIRLRCRVHGGQVRIAVDDAAAHAPPKLRTPRTEQPLLGGRGLHIVQSVSTSWGTQTWPWGKTIWADIALDR